MSLFWSDLARSFSRWRLARAADRVILRLAAVRQRRSEVDRERSITADTETRRRLDWDVVELRCDITQLEAELHYIRQREKALDREETL